MKNCIYSLIIIFVTGIFVMQARAEENITIAAVGDIMLGTNYPNDLLPPNDGAELFDHVKGYLGNSDIVYGNLEGPLTFSEDQTKCKDESKNCYAFRTPPDYVDRLKSAGFKVMNIANNHTADFGYEGIESTVYSLSASDIEPVGGTHIAAMKMRSKRIAIAGFSYMPVSEHSYSINNIEKAKEIVKELKGSNDIVIVSFHGGAEGKKALHVTGEEETYLGEERGNVMEFSHSVIDAGADLVLGHGPHVLRAIEIYRGKLIVYSLGNFLVYERFNIDGESGISMILNVKLDPETGDFVDGKITPVKVVDKGVPMIDNKKMAIDLVKKLTEEDVALPGIRIAENGSLNSESSGKKEVASVKKRSSAQ
jgi:poly-gamma-glutamate capsule biosynthesis protein CapA/YwtB (metallophosphatase superfamily)